MNETSYGRLKQNKTVRSDMLRQQQILNLSDSIYLIKTYWYDYIKFHCMYEEGINHYQINICIRKRQE